MLARQSQRPGFTRGLEAALITSEIAKRLKALRPRSLFFAYDTPSYLPSLGEAGKILREAGFTTPDHILQCYVLVGYKGDTMDKAMKRLGEAWIAGFLPFAMLFRDEQGKCSAEWRRFQREFASPKKSRPNCIKYFGKSQFND